MATLFGSSSSSTAAAPTPPEASLRVQTSLEGLPRTILWGTTRIAGNLIWYGNFVATPASNGAPPNGGKGGLFSPAPSTTASSGFNYSTAVEVALCEGPIVSIGPMMWAGKARTTLSAAGFAAPEWLVRLPEWLSGLTLFATGFGLFLGTAVQTAWSFLTARYPGQAFTYRYTAYVAGNVNLGSSPTLPNWTFETRGTVNEVATLGIVDADPTKMVADFLTNATYGVPGWGAAFNGDWSNASDYVVSAGLLVSYALTSQVSASSFLTDVLTSINVDAVWSEATLKLVPRGDAAIAGRGRAYFPPAAPIYDLTDSDYLANQSSFGSTNADPVSCQQMAARDQNNVVKVEYLPRAADYNSATISAKDDGAVTRYGERGNESVKSWHWFQTSDAANMAAHLALGREQIANRYAVTVRPRYILLDPGDIITLSDSGLGLSRQWVKIEEVRENSDRSINLLVQEYLQGTGAAPLYGREAGSGGKPNYLIDPGPINPPLLFEPTDELAHGLEVWAAISGVDPTTYGGCDVYISYDGESYTQVAGGRSFGSVRMGVLSAPLPSFQVAVDVATIDAVNTLKVDLTESGGILESVSQLDALAFNSACYVGGEIVSYMNSQLAGVELYNLTYLVRGCFGTQDLVGLHATGTPFARLDHSVLRMPFDQSRIGATVYLKFLPFNVYGATVNTLADVPAHTYKILGTALASPLPPVTQVRTVVKDRFAEIWWKEVNDFRSSIGYIIRKGTSFTGGQEMGTLAHPPFTAFGAGTYWIMPTCQPVAGLIVYSDTPVSATIQGNMLTANIVQTTDYQALGWLGTFQSTAKEGADPTSFVRLVGSSDILTNTDFLAIPDVLNAGVIAPTGLWTASLYLDVGYVADVYLNITWTSAGIPVGTDVLSDADFLNNPDVLQTGAGRFVEVWIEVRTAGVFVSDMFQPVDLFDPTTTPDIFTSGIAWTAWQRYVPGVYRAEFIQYRVAFSTVQPIVIAYLTSLVVQATIPARIDHYIGNTVGTGGLQIVFEPDDGTAAKPFNGGPLVGGINNHPLPAVSMDWPGHPEANFKIDSLDLAQVTFHFEDASAVHVAVSGVDTYVEGY